MEEREAKTVIPQMGAACGQLPVRYLQANSRYVGLGPPGQRPLPGARLLPLDTTVPT